MTEFDFMYNKFFFFDEASMPFLSSISASVPFINEKKKENTIEFAMLCAFLEVIFGSFLYFERLDEDSDSINLRMLRMKMIKEKGCCFKFNIFMSFLDRIEFLYNLFLFKNFSGDKRDLSFFNGLLRIGFKDLESGSFLLGDHKVNLSFDLIFDCNSSKIKHKESYIYYLLPFFGVLYSIGHSPRIYRDEFDFLNNVI